MLLKALGHSLVLLCSSVSGVIAYLFDVGYSAARRPAKERFHLSCGQQDLQEGSSQDSWFLTVCSRHSTKLHNCSCCNYQQLPGVQSSGLEVLSACMCAASITSLVKTSALHCSIVMPSHEQQHMCN